MKNQLSNWNTRDSSGRKGLGETPQSVARGGSSAARGKRVYSSCGSRREYFDATTFSNTQLLFRSLERTFETFYYIIIFLEEIAIKFLGYQLLAIGIIWAGMAFFFSKMTSPSKIIFYLVT